MTKCVCVGSCSILKLKRWKYSWCWFFRGNETISAPHPPPVSLFLADPPQRCYGWTRGGSIQRVGDRRIPGDLGGWVTSQRQGHACPLWAPCPRARAWLSLQVSVWHCAITQCPVAQELGALPAPGGASPSTSELTKNRHGDLGSHPSSAVPCRLVAAHVGSVLEFLK